MSNKNIREYLDFYTKHKGQLEYAILLDGQWGSGKTYFIKNYIKENDPKKFLYVSLYGLKNVSEIEDRFLQLSFPVLHSAPVKFLRGIVGSVELFGLRIDTTSVGLKDFLAENKNGIIVFDDLERCEISINTTLGYINHLVEHQGSKVIILAHEEKVVPSKVENSDVYLKYIEIKEKLVGRTFSIIVELEPALNNFIKNAQDSSVRKVLERNIQTVTYAYKNIGYHNLRSLRQVIDEFERFYAILPEKAKACEELLSELLNLMMIFVFENRKGLIVTEEIKNISTASIHSIASQVGNKNEAVRVLSNREKFLKKYESKNFYEICPSDSCWYDFFKYGTVESSKLEESIQNSKFFRHENTQEWVKLWHFRDIDEKEFVELHKAVKEKFENYEYRIPGILKHVTGLLISFSKDGIIETPVDSIKKYIVKVLNELNDEGMVVYEEKNHGRVDDAYAGLGFFSIETNEFKEVAEIIDGYAKKAKERSFPAIAEQVLAYVKSDPHKFWEALSPHMSSSLKLNNVPILQYIDPDKFVEEYILCPNHKKDLISYAFKDRYEFVSSNPSLYEEFECIAEIEKKLEAIEKTSTHFNKYRIKIFREYTLKKALENLAKQPLKKESKI